MSIRRPLALAATLAFGLSVAGAALPAQAAPKDGSTLTLFNKRLTRETVDFPPNGTTVGDLTVGTGTLARTQGGAVIGTLSWSAQNVQVNIPGGIENRLSIQWLTLPGGALETSSLVSVPQGTTPVKTQQYVIVGGTGKYAGARGSMAFTPLGPEDYKMVFRFTS